MAASPNPTRRRVRALLIVAGAIAVLVVVVRRILAPPASPPEYPDARPDEAAADEYVSVTQSVFIEAAPERVWEWSNGPDVHLEDLVQFEDFPAVVGTVPLVGEGRPGERVGNRRRVEFADGNYVAEEVLVDSHERYRYMTWGFTSPQRFVVKHGIAEFGYSAENGGTRLTWKYDFLPTAKILRPAVESFLASTMSPMMRATLAAMREGVEGAVG